MDILVIGGTRFFGIYLVEELIKRGHNVTIATRGIAKDNFGSRVSRIILERTNEESIRKALNNKFFDVVYDKIAYCSNDVKYVLDSVKCNKYIMMSSVSVYKMHSNIVEEDFNPLEKELVWCDRADFPYDEIKRQSECALFQKYKNIKAVSVRYPFVIGKDDYTKRLYFYVEHVFKKIPMHIDSIDCQMGFIRSIEAGEFMAFLADKAFTGPINGSSYGTISVREILNYIEEKTGTKATLSESGDEAPYNGGEDYSVNVNKAESLGYKFSNLRDYIFKLLDYYINQMI